MAVLKKTIKGVLIGLFLYGAVLFLLGKMLVFKTGVDWIYGLAFGIGMAALLFLHMSFTIQYSLKEQRGENYLILQSTIRKLIMLVALIVAIKFFGPQGAIMTLLGMLGLKVSALTQPLWIRNER